MKPMAYTSFKKDSTAVTFYTEYTWKNLDAAEKEIKPRIWFKRPETEKERHLIQDIHDAEFPVKRFLDVTREKIKALESYSKLEMKYHKPLSTLQHLYECIENYEKFCEHFAIYSDLMKTYKEGV